MTSEGWTLTIKRVDNGYYLIGSNVEVVIEERDDPLECHKDLLYEVMSYFDFMGSKHDAERLWVVRKKTDEE